MKILHVTYHSGCAKNIEYVCKELGYNLETQFANWNYNISANRANEIYDKYKDYYNQFDVIITSDTGPLARIFLQNTFKKLIIWVCNRFDYADMATNDCNFPDKEFYELYKNAANNPNVKIFSYTKFEHEYAREFRGVELGQKVLKPCAFIDNSEKTLNLKDTFFIPPYHNDSIFMNLKAKCDDLGIKTYAGRYNGPKDLEDCNGIIHIPYAWSNLALFENWTLGNVYFIPSKDFLIQLSQKNNFFWSPPFSIKHIESSEWYLPEHKDLFIYFNSWEELKELHCNAELIKNKKNKCLNFMQNHTKNMLKIWNNIISE